MNGNLAVSPDELVLIIGLKDVELFLLRRQVAALLAEKAEAKEQAEPATNG